VEVWVCHCLECQRQSGSPFGYVAGWPKSAMVAMTGETRTWTRSSYRGRSIENVFCATCGSTVLNYAESMPDIVMINVGNFADEAFPAPSVEYWTEHRHPWVSIPTATQRWRKQEEDGEEG
jgi:hypothetical protein